MFWFFFYLSIGLFVFISVLLTLIVLIQKGRGGGLASAFGGGGSSSAFGAKTGDVLTWATSIIFGVFLLLGVVLNLMARHLPQMTADADTTNNAPIVTPTSKKPAADNKNPVQVIPPAPAAQPKPDPAKTDPTPVEKTPDTPTDNKTENSAPTTQP